jgi:outer membrane protease
MKNIVFFFILVCLSLRPPLPAEDRFPYTLSIAPQFGILYGQGEEQVFNDRSEELLSRLLWDLKPLYYGGTRMEFGQRDPLGRFGFFSFLSLKFGFPMETGIMEDWDWQGPAGELTNYSQHNAFTEGAVMLDLAAGPNIPLRSFLILRPSLGLSYTRFSWTARDGYLRYGKLTGGSYEPLDESDLPQPATGNSVSYAQDWIFMPIGLSLWILPDRIFSGALWFYGGPMLKFVGMDEHLSRTRTYFQRDPNGFGQFWDEIIGGYSLEPGGEFRFSPMDRFSMRLYGSWRRVAAKPRGKSYARFTGNGDWDWDFLGNFSGGAFQTMDLGLSFEIRL